jgi:hypothetical protein
MTAEDLLCKAVLEKHWAAASFIAAELADHAMLPSLDLWHATNKAIEDAIDLALPRRKWGHVFECAAELHRRQEVRTSGHKKEPRKI